MYKNKSVLFVQIHKTNIYRHKIVYYYLIKQFDNSLYTQEENKIMSLNKIVKINTIHDLILA